MSRVLLTFLLLLSPAIADSQVRIDQAQLAHELMRGTATERAAAVSQIRGIPPGEREAVLVAALLGELDRLARQQEMQMARLRAGQHVDPSDDEAEYLSDVLKLVAQLKEPSAIPSLVAFLGTGTVVDAAVAAFGELAVGRVVVVASGDVDVGPALMTLTKMLRSPVDYPLTDGSKALIADVARTRLQGSQKFTYVAAAIDLAAATGDAELLGRLAQLARDGSEFRNLGIDDVNDQRNLRQRASRALSGRRGR